MKKYKVLFWFNNNDGDADRIIVLETDKTERQAIINLALQEVGRYPRTYWASVEDANDISMQEYHVVEIINSNKAHEEAWYHNRDGEMYVTYLNKGKHVTCQKLGNSQSIGEIEEKFCRVVTKFKHLDTY